MTVKQEGQVVHFFFRARFAPFCARFVRFRARFAQDPWIISGPKCQHHACQSRPNARRHFSSSKRQPDRVSQSSRSNFVMHSHATGRLLLPWGVSTYNIVPCIKHLCVVPWVTHGQGFKHFTASGKFPIFILEEESDATIWKISHASSHAWKQERLQYRAQQPCFLIEVNHGKAIYGVWGYLAQINS